MRHSTLLSSILALCLLAQLPWAGPSCALAREWTVSGPETLTDQTVHLEENITVVAGGRLVIDNVTLLFNSTETTPLVLEARTGGELLLRNSTLASNGSGPYLVRALPGSRLALSGCTVSRAGTCATVPENAGFMVSTDQSSIDNTTFRDGAAGLHLRNCSIALSDCQFLANEAGLVLDGSNATLRRCRFAADGDRQLLLLNGSRARTLDTDLDPALVEVADAASSLDIQWSLTVEVAWDTGRPAEGAIVSVKPADGPALLYRADGSGSVPDIAVLSSTVSAGGLRGHGPFNISAESGGKTAWNITEIDSAREVRLVLDNTPPSITIDSPREGARLNGTPLPATGSARDINAFEDLPSVRLVEARIDDGPWSRANGTDSWSFGLSGLPEGLHTLTARAWDLAGNSNQSSVGFEVDLSAPSLMVWPPAGHLTSAGNVTVRIVTDGDRVLFNGAPVAGHTPGRPLEVDWELELEGDNEAGIESRDAAGNAARTRLRVVRDSTPPEVNFTSPPAYSVLGSPLVTITGQSSDLHGIALVEWGFDRENWTRANGTAEWSFQALLREGRNTVYLRATDGAGNAMIGWLPLDLRLPDTTPPELRIVYPEDGQKVGSPVMDVVVRATDAGGVGPVELSIDGTVWVNATGTGDRTGRLSLLPGNNTIRARARDLSGNVNSTAVSVVYSPPPPDTVPPDLAVLYPPPGLKVAQSKMVVSGKAADPSGIAFVEVSTDKKRWTRCILTGEDWSTTVTLSPGQNTISVRARDNFGNSAQSSTEAVFDRPADPAAGRTTLMLILVLVLLALLAAWLVARAPAGKGGAAPAAGDGEE